MIRFRHSLLLALVPCVALAQQAGSSTTPTSGVDHLPRSPQFSRTGGADATGVGGVVGIQGNNGTIVVPMNPNPPETPPPPAPSPNPSPIGRIGWWGDGLGYFAGQAGGVCLRSTEMKYQLLILDSPINGYKNWYREYPNDETWYPIPPGMNLCPLSWTSPGRPYPEFPGDSIPNP